MHVDFLYWNIIFIIFEFLLKFCLLLFLKLVHGSLFLNSFRKEFYILSKKKDYITKLLKFFTLNHINFKQKQTVSRIFKF